MKNAQRQRPQRNQKPKKQRRFAKVDVANLSDEDDNENPDWLVGAY